MTSLDDLTRHQQRTVETAGGPVVLRSLTWAQLSEFIDLPPAEQAPELIAACSVDPELTAEQAATLPPGVVLQLLPVCMELNGLNGPD